MTIYHGRLFGHTCFLFVFYVFMFSCLQLACSECRTETTKQLVRGSLNCMDPLSICFTFIAHVWTTCIDKE